MALKPTIQIAIDDSAFQKFQADVQAFKASMGQTSGASATGGTASPLSGHTFSPGMPGYPNVVPPVVGSIPGYPTMPASGPTAAYASSYSYSAPQAAPSPFVQGYSTTFRQPVVPGYPNTRNAMEPHWNAADLVGEVVEALNENARNNKNDSPLARLQKSTDAVLEPTKKLSLVFKDIDEHTQNTTLAMLRWSGIAGLFSTLVGGGLVGGLLNIARGASTGRTTASGLGISQGELSAFSIAYGRYGLGESTIQNIADAQGNPSSDTYRGLLLMGFSPEEIANTDPSVLASRAIAKAKAQYQKVRGSPQLLDAYKTTSVFSLSELRRFSNTPDEELQQEAKDFEKYSKSLNVPDSDAAKYQAALAKLEAIGDSIQKNLTIKIVELHDTLESPGFLSGLKKFNSFLRWVAGGQEDPEYAAGVAPDTNASSAGPTQDDMRARSYSNGAIRDRTPYAIRLYRYLFGTEGVPNSPDTGINPAPQTGGDNKTFSELETQYGLPYGILMGTYGAESNFGKDLSTSKAGAMGPFQFLQSTGALYGLLSNSDFMDTNKSARAAARYYAMLLNLKFINGDPRKAIAAYNWGEGKLQQDIEKHGSDWESFLPAETKGQLNKVFPYLNHPNLVIPPNGAPVSARDTNIRIVLENRTGASAAMSVQQLAVPA